jgi:hypothetical protein
VETNPSITSTETKCVMGAAMQAVEAAARKNVTVEARAIPQAAQGLISSLVAYPARLWGCKVAHCIARDFSLYSSPAALQQLRFGSPDKWPSASVRAWARTGLPG